MERADGQLLPARCLADHAVITARSQPYDG